MFTAIDKRHMDMGSDTIASYRDWRYLYDYAATHPELLTFTYSMEDCSIDIAQRLGVYLAHLQVCGCGECMFTFNQYSRYRVSYIAGLHQLIYAKFPMATTEGNPLFEQLNNWVPFEQQLPGIIYYSWDGTAYYVPTMEEEAIRKSFAEIYPLEDDDIPIIGTIRIAPDDRDVGYFRISDEGDEPDLQDLMDSSDSFSEYRDSLIPFENVGQVMSKEFHDSKYHFQGGFPEALDICDAHVMAWLDDQLPF